MIVNWKKIYIGQSVILTAVQWLFMYTAAIYLSPEYLSTYFISTAIFVPISVFFGMQLKNIIILDSDSLFSIDRYTSIRIYQTVLSLLLSFSLITAIYGSAIFYIVFFVLINKGVEFFVEVKVGDELRRSRYREASIIVAVKSVSYILPAVMIASDISGFYSFLTLASVSLVILLFCLRKARPPIIGGFHYYDAFSRSHVRLGMSQLFAQGLFPVQRAVIALYAPSELNNLIGLGLQCILAAQVLSVPIAQVFARALRDIPGSSFNKVVLSAFAITMTLGALISYVTQYVVLNELITDIDGNSFLGLLIAISGMVLGSGSLLNLIAIKNSLENKVVILNGLAFIAVSVMVLFLRPESIQGAVLIISIGVIARGFALAYVVRKA